MKKNLITICLCFHLLAGENRWVAFDAGSWNDPKNWYFRNTKDGTETYVLSDDILVPPYISVCSDATLANLKIDYDWIGLGYTIDSANGSSLIFTNAVGSGRIDVTNTRGNGAHAIRCPIVLTAPLEIHQSSDSQFVISGPIHEAGAPQSLTLVGDKTLLLTGENNYSGGTIIESGTLSIASDANMGSPDGTLVIGDGTLQITQDMPSKRAGVLNGRFATIDTQNHTVAFDGPLSGKGNLTKKGNGVLVLSGMNSYSGATSLEMGQIEGNTNSLQGSITVHEGTTLRFDQNFDGSYKGAVKGKGSLIKTNEGLLEIVGDQADFQGKTQVVQGELKVNGSLARSSVNISHDAILSGNGIIGPTRIEKGGKISPGNSIGTTQINGSLLLSPGAIAEIEFSPTTADLILSGETVIKDAQVNLKSTPGFYGFETNYTILNATSIEGTFAGIESEAPGFQTSISYTPNNVVLTVRNPHPFQDFPFTQENARAVAQNLEKLYSQGELSTQLSYLINACNGKTSSFIETILNEMHPAAYNQFTEFQTENLTQLVSLFSMNPFQSTRTNTLWAKPFINTAKINGLRGLSTGVAMGTRFQPLETFAFGFGAIFDQNRVKLASNQGSSSSEGYYGSVYGSYQHKHLYLGTLLYSGTNSCESNRNVAIFTSQHAKAQFAIFNLVGRIETAYSFDFPYFQLYPYGNLNFIYARTGKINESGANEFDLSIQNQNQLTQRSEVGITLRAPIQNRKIRISPVMSLGWVNMIPLSDNRLTSRFAGTETTFSINGCNEIWNLLSCNLGLETNYKAFTIHVDYSAEVSPTSALSLIDQCGTLMFDWKW